MDEEEYFMVYVLNLIIKSFNVYRKCHEGIALWNITHIGC